MKPDMEEDPDIVDDIILEAILDTEDPVVTVAAPPPVAPLLLLLAAAVEDEAQEAAVGKVTPPLSTEEVNLC